MKRLVAMLHYVGIYKYVPAYCIAKFILYPLTYRDYRLREKGKKPDEWYWADVQLLKWGFLKREYK